MELKKKLTRASSSFNNLSQLTASAPKPILPKYLIKRYSAENMASSFKNNSESPSRPPSWTPFGKSKNLDEDIKLKLADLDSLEIARQITLIESGIFMSIKVF